MNRFTPSNSPPFRSITPSFLTGWFAPAGEISWAILPSSQEMAPQSAGRSGVMTQTWSGAKVWQSVQE